MLSKIAVRSSLTNESVELEAEVPEPLRNEHGHVYRNEEGGWRIRIRLPKEYLAKLPPKTPSAWDVIGRCETSQGAAAQLEGETKGKHVRLLLADKPWLTDLLDNQQAIWAAEAAAREAYWNGERAAEQERKRVRALELQAGLPDGWVVGWFHRFEAIPGTDGYGWSWYETPDGQRIKLDNQIETREVSDETHGWYAAYIAVRNVEAAAYAQAAQAAEEANQAAEQARVRAQQAADRHAELMAVQVPADADAVAAYMACSGDPERLEDDIDNPLYWLVKRYTDAIEAQGLAADAALRRAVQQATDAVVEANYGIDEG